MSSITRLTARVPASCGELIQGYLDGRDFLVTSPIDLYAEATAWVDSEKSCLPSPTAHAKTRRAIALAAAVKGLAEVNVTLRSAIPRGKGMASSTAELVAGSAAVMGLGGGLPDERALGSLAVAIEASDAVYASGIVRGNPLTGEILSRYGPPPSLAFAVVDTGGTVETDRFDRERARAISRRFEPSVRAAVALLEEGFRARSARLIAKAATLSARIHQHVLPKPGLEDCIRVAREEGALGVNCAHTGTVLGVMFDPERADPIRLEERLRRERGRDAFLGMYALVSGGVRWEGHACTPCKPRYPLLQFPGVAAGA